MMRKTIGIDLGDCGTTAAYPRPLDGGKYEVRHLVVWENPTVPTQLVLTNRQMARLKDDPKPGALTLQALEQETGEILIGKNLPVYVDDGEKFIYFKKPPAKFDNPCGNSLAAKENGITHGTLMACFAYALVKAILRSNPGDFDPSDLPEIDLLVGCPTTADWISPEAASVYASLVQNATGVHSVSIVPESRAAMFSCIEDGNNPVSALKGALVFDFGSSTADCTYMLLGRKRIEFSWTLGASEVERQMAVTAYHKAVEEYGPFEPDMPSFSSNVDLLRTVKENFYDGLYGSKEKKIMCEFLPKDQPDAPTVDAIVGVSADFMEKVTGENQITVATGNGRLRTGSWQSLCRAFMEEGKRRINNAYYEGVDEEGQPVQLPCTLGTVVITGGASKMPFVYQLCREIFPEAEFRKEGTRTEGLSEERPSSSHIVWDRENPFRTVSTGLAWVAVTESHLPDCIEETKDFIAKDDRCNLHALRSSLLEALYSDVVTPLTEETTLSWAHSEENLSLEDLDSLLRLAPDRPEVRQNTDAAVRRAIDKWEEISTEVILNKVNEEVVDLYSEHLGEDLVIQPELWRTIPTDFGQGLKESINFSPIMERLNFNSWFRNLFAGALSAVTGTLEFASWVLFGDAEKDPVKLSRRMFRSLSDRDRKKPRTALERSKLVAKMREQLKTAQVKQDLQQGLSDEMEAILAPCMEGQNTVIRLAFETAMLKYFGKEGVQDE